MPGPSFLALDIGTSSVRASIYDARLRQRQSVQIRYRWRESAGGVVELDPDRLVRLVAQAVDRVLESHRRPIDAVATAAFWHSLLGIDGSGRALTPLIPWSDLRAAEEADRLRRRWRERSVHARTGCRLHPSYWPAKLAWFERHDPGTFGRVRRWVSFGELLERRWLGRAAVSVSQASGTGLFDQDRCDWSDTLLEACHIGRASVSPIVDLDDASGELAPALARRWPQLASARWVPVIGDGAANNAGAGCVTRGRAAAMIGTSGAMRVLWTPRRGERVRPSFGLWRYRLDRSRVVVGGALSNGGNVRDWLLRTLSADPAIVRKAAALAPDAHGLTVLPFFAGTRSPDYLTDASATITGLRFATRPEHLLRASVEAVAYRFARIFDELISTVRVQEVVAAGGALESSHVWTQILADVLNRPILHSRDRELTSRGIAALARDAIGAGRLEDLPPLEGRPVTPDRGRHAVYAEAMQRQQELMDRMYGRLH